MNPIILIPARLAATRLPRKPLADIAGKPMIVHVWQRAMESGLGPVYVACDSEEIADAVTRAGGQAVLTQSNHASGSDRIFEALQRLDAEKRFDTVVNVQGDMPTIHPAVIRQAVMPLQRDDTFDIATLAAPITREEERLDPAVVKPVIAFRDESQTSGRALYFSRATVPTGEGKHYHHIGIYAYRRAALERFVSLPPSPLERREKLEQLRALEAGMTMGISVIDTVPLGVDTPEHLETARRLLA
jgi:3-deoxy-manno-octulosonate cytidylyltransferase (CMP-KDO synthetase)